MARTGNANSATGTPKENADDLAGANGVALKNTRDRALVRYRVRGQHTPHGRRAGPAHRDRKQRPRRTDLGDLPNYRTHKHHLFGDQERYCGGCRVMFPFRIFEVDHIPRAKGGSDHRDNLQLLCGACNRGKGTGTQAELIAKLRERGHLAA